MESPLISRIQRIIIYETKARFYVVGSNDTETAFRVLKIDRTEPKELHIQDDKHVYNQLEIQNLLTMIESGNRTVGKQKSAGITKTVSAFGIVGFVRFLEGYYMILVKRRHKEALIGGHTVYKIEDTSMLYIPNDGVRYTHADEQRYLKLFQSVDLSSNFYFSYSYDLTHTLQYNLSPSLDLGNTEPSGEQRQTNNTDPPDKQSRNEEGVHGVRMKPAERFVWNKHLLSLLETEAHHDWILHIMYGFIGQSNLHIFGKSVYITLIARRSNEFAGTRFLKRGANSQGAVANEVETEQIVHDASVTQLSKTKVSSYVQLRGSIPLFWSQDISKMVPKPQISIDQCDPYFYTAGVHFNKCLRRYGAPIVLLNLIKRKERRKQESLLKEEYVNCKNYLNQFLPPDQHILYLGFDMARHAKSVKRKTSNVLERLATISIRCVKKTGFFFHSPNMTEDFWMQPEFEGVEGYKTPSGLKQTGVVRTNCVDCLDRTNTSQFAVGKCALEYQLCAIGVIPTPDLDFDTHCLKILEELYEALGDTVALQYGGSQLVHRIEGYRKIAPWKSHSNDILQTLSRYYSNTFSDVEKQQATNVFLGLFVPRECELNIWDLTTDFYLHNRDAVLYKVPRRSYTNWCEAEVFDYLPLPYEEGCKHKNYSVLEVTESTDEKVDIFAEYYRPQELTKFDELFTIRYLLPKSSKAPLSPFKMIMSENIRENSQEANPSISGKDSTSSVKSNTSEEGSSSSCSSVEGDLQSTSEDGEDFIVKQTGVVENMEEENIYGLDLSTFEKDENTQDIYKNYMSLGFLDEEERDVGTDSMVLDKQGIHVNQKLSSYAQSPQFSMWVESGRDQSMKALPRGGGEQRNRDSSSGPGGSYISWRDTLKMTPLGEYRSDIYSVELPTVSHHSLDIYEQYVRRGWRGAAEPPEENKEIYRKYVRQLYR